jgi:hypothetical protein
MNHPVTTRMIAKKVAQALVASQVARLTRGAITDYTRFDKDDMIVEVGSGTVGWLVSEYCAPVTDKIVDKASDYIVIKRGERKSKKTSEEK